MPPKPPPISLYSRLLRLAVVAVALFTWALNWQSARAEDVIHVVQPGETLFRIGLRYGVSWVAIMQANGLVSTTIYVGQPLIIPSGGDLPASVQPAPAEPAVLPPPATPAPVVETPPLPVQGSGTYIVQRGDTLFGIAASHGVNLAALAAANNIYNLELIYAGQVLIIPGGASAPNASAPSSAKQIVVSISEQHLYAYENGQLVYSFTASTGMAGSGTWAGTFSVLDKIPNAYGANWNIWMPNWLGIYWAGTLENGIHALPILANGLRLWDGYLGTPVSYGCVILGVEDAQTLYDWADVGTPVIIRY